MERPSGLDGTTGDRLERGCIFVQVLRPLNFEPDIYISTCAGSLRQSGIPVRRARIRVPGREMTAGGRKISAVLRERLRAFLEARPLSHVILNNTTYPGLDEEIRAALPGVTILVQGRDLPAYLPRLIRARIEGDATPARPPRADTPHWALHGDLYAEFYDLVQNGRPSPMLDVIDLTPEVPAAGMEGDLFIDQLCYYRAPYKGEDAALAGASSCTFCAIPQATVRPRRPDLNVAVTQIEAYLAADPAARVFHVIDYGILGHLAELAETIRRVPVSGLELCASVRAPDLLAQRQQIEAALPLFAAAGNRFHVFNVGFESFSASEFARLNKGYPVLQNVACIRYLQELEARYPDAFVFSRWGAHGFIGVTCWSALSDLRTNAFFAHALGFGRLSRQFFLKKLRLYPQLPLHELARRDGLLASGEYSDWRMNNAYWTGYADEVPYRFLHADTDRAYRWTMRLLMPESEAECHWSSQLRDELTPAWQDDWELAVYAAVLRTVAREPATVSDEEFAAAVRRAARLPTLDLFPSSDLEGDAGHFPPDPSPAGDIGALEAMLLARGIKPTAKIEMLEPAKAQGLAAALRGEGLHVVLLEEVATPNLARRADAAGVERDDRYTVVAGREPDDVAQLVALIREAAPDDPASWRGAGRLLGYPDCCTAALAVHPLALQTSDMHLLAQSIARTQGRIEAALDPFLPSATIEYFPCRMDCPASLERARRAGRAADQAAPAGAALVLGPRTRIELDDVVEIANGWRYGAARLRGTSPWGEHIVGQLRRGNRVEILPRLLFVYRDHDLLAAIPHGVIVPIAYGVPNRFDWLAQVARQVVPAGAASAAPVGNAAGLMRDLLPEPLGTCAVKNVRLDGESMLIDLGEHASGVALELRLADPARAAYLRGGGVAVSYRLTPGAAFSPIVDGACRALLSWAEGNTALVETTLRRAL
jgi:hypothetical protein